MSISAGLQFDALFGSEAVVKIFHQTKEQMRHCLLHWQAFKAFLISTSFRRFLDYMCNFNNVFLKRQKKHWIFTWRQLLEPWTKQTSIIFWWYTQCFCEILIKKPGLNFQSYIYTLANLKPFPPPPQKNTLRSALHFSCLDGWWWVSLAWRHPACQLLAVRLVVKTA